MINYFNRFFLFFIIVIVGCAIWMATPWQSSDVKIYNLNWTNQQTSFDEAYQNSDTVILGKIKNKETYEDKMVVFTLVEVEATEVIKGDNKDSYKILFTGGELNGTIYKSEECVIPSEDGTYLFLLKSRENEGEYIPIGGYQGVFELDTKSNKTITKEVKIKSFNQNNRIENEIINKDLKVILEEKKQTVDTSHTK